jgi:hypothetical protein
LYALRGHKEKTYLLGVKRKAGYILVLENKKGFRMDVFGDASKRTSPEECRDKEKPNGVVL